MIRRALLLIAAAVVLSAGDDPSLYLKDPAQESRARELFQEIRCVVCQNETVAASEAPIAQQVRQIIRDQVAAGQSDQEIKDYLRQRWGDFVLLKPRFTPRTAILWLLPFAIVLIGVVTIVLRRPRPAATAVAGEAELTPDELKALKQLQENSASGGVR
jgi:cytochrome c-type biogenesis protein CcmH